MAKKRTMAPEPETDAVVYLDPESDTLASVTTNPANAAELFAAYEHAEAYLTEVKRGIEAAQEAQSAAVKAILDGLGKGPFQFKGKQLTVAVRGGVHFFRTQRSATVIE